MKSVIIFMPAYHAEKTIAQVWEKIPNKYKENTFLIDDNSADNTFEIAQKLGIECYKNKTNLGYGGNIKTCLAKALKKGGEILIEMHPDGEYDPGSISPAINVLTPKTGMVLGNRTEALQSGMYVWKYIPSKLLTQFDNLILQTKLSDLHQGFRIYTRTMLEKVPFMENSNNYLFSFEIIAQTIYYGFTIEEIPVKTHYSGNKRGASLGNSLRYSIDTFPVLIQFLFAKFGFTNAKFGKVPEFQNIR